MTALYVRDIVMVVMRSLSAIGSITLPTTVWRLYRRAYHPSNKSVRAETLKRNKAGERRELMTR